MRGEAEVAKLQVGDLTTTKLPVIVLDHPALKILGEALAVQSMGSSGSHSLPATARQSITRPTR